MADNEKYACGYKNSQTGEIVYYKDKDARSQLKDIAKRFIEINVKYPTLNLSPLTGDGIVDETNNLQMMIDYLNNNGGGVLYFPNGNYKINAITLKSNVTLKGENRDNVILSPLNATDDMFVLDDGNVSNLLISSMSFIGNKLNANQNCFNLVGKSRLVADYDGGLWNFNMKNILIKDFDGVAIKLSANRQQGDVAHQWLNFDDVTVFRTVSDTSYNLVLEGRIEHVNFTNCQFDGEGKGTEDNLGYNIIMRREFQDDGVTPISDKAPTNIYFSRCTIQKSQRGIKIDRCRNVSFENCWFESIYKAFDIEFSSFNILFLKNYMANIGNKDANSYVFNVGALCNAVIENNSITYSDNIVGKLFNNTYANHDGIICNNNYTNSPPVVSNYTKYISELTNGYLMANARRMVILATSNDTTVKGIVSQIVPGEDLTILLYAGATSNITFSSGFFVNKQDDLIVNGKHCLVVTKCENSYMNGWFIKSYY